MNEHLTVVGAAWTTRTTWGRACLVGLGAMVATLAGGCGAADAEASTEAAAEASASAGDLLAFVETARGAARSRASVEAMGAVPGASLEDAGPRLTMDRPRGYAADLERPPLDTVGAGRLAPEDVVVSFAMLAEAGRFAEQWPLLSVDSQSAWVERVRQEANRVGRASAEARAAGDGQALWADAFAAESVRVDLDVAWRTTASIREAEVAVHRDGITIDVVRLVREDGAWRLDLSERIASSG